MTNLLLSVVACIFTSSGQRTQPIEKPFGNLVVNAFPSSDLATDSTNFDARFEETVLVTLVVSARMVVVEIQGNGQKQHLLAEEDHLV